MGALKRGVDGKVIYDGGLVTEIHRVNVETCNLFFVEGLFLNLGYPGYNEVYWLEPGLELGKGLRVLRTDAEVMRICESAMKNDNTVHLYFDHPIDANPEIIDEEVVSDGSSDSVVEVNPDGDSVKEDEVTNKVDGHANEKENEGVNETSGEVNELEMVLSVAVKENVNEGVNEATVDVNESNKGESGAGKKLQMTEMRRKTLKEHQLRRKLLRRLERDIQDQPLVVYPEKEKLPRMKFLRVTMEKLKLGMNPQRRPMLMMLLV
ncbi:hypothetical protein Ahy_A05g025106 [Arachis hypogaea]|uniref:PB1-like domain-containing protein n=1 Tax=Arachis hypogaea TaxID=3818 RepID=A0A445D7I8_ARAHY|nr:hypothetical protein Ahy_A05g025106 [Arachis hypogaea]